MYDTYCEECPKIAEVCKACAVSAAADATDAAVACEVARYDDLKAKVEALLDAEAEVIAASVAHAENLANNAWSACVETQRRINAAVPAETAAREALRKAVGR